MGKIILFVLAMLASVALPAPAEDLPVAGKVPPGVYKRTVFLGDSITDGNTYPQLVRQALADAKLPKMVAINAGIGGDTSSGMRARLDRDVMPHHPTLVIVSAGANDAMHGVSGDSYEENISSIIDYLRRQHVAVILLTPNVLGPKMAEKGQKNLDMYEAILRKLSADEGIRLAEVNQRQKNDAALGHAELAADDLHPNWQGQTMIARAVLDAMGYAELKVPDHITNEALPGVISPWRVKHVDAKDAPLSEASVEQIKPDDSWLTLTPPETKPIPDFDLSTRWLDDYRTLGASVSLRQQPAGSYVGIAHLKSDSDRKLYFHTGAELEQVWLNGKQIYQNQWKHGYHIGRQSVSGEVKAGENEIVIRTGQVFFLSATEKEEMWE